MKRKNIATLILGILSSSICGLLSILAIVVYLLADSAQIVLLTNVLEQGFVFTLLFPIVTFSHWLVTAFAFWSSVTNGFNSEKGGIFQLITALLGSVLPIMYFIAKSYILGAVFMIPVLVYLCLGLWSFFAKPKGYVAPEKKGNKIVLLFGVTLSLLTMIYSFVLMAQAYGTIDILANEISPEVYRIIGGGLIIIFSGFLAFIASCISGFKSKNGGIFLIICSFITLTGAVVAFVSDPWITLSFVPFPIYLALGIWAVCTKPKKIKNQQVQTANHQQAQPTYTNYNSDKFNNFNQPDNQMNNQSNLKPPNQTFHNTPNQNFNKPQQNAINQQSQQKVVNQQVQQTVNQQIVNKPNKQTNITPSQQIKELKNLQIYDQLRQQASQVKQNQNNDDKKE